MNSQAPCKTCAAIAALLKKAQAGSPQARVLKSALKTKTTEDRR